MNRTPRVILAALACAALLLSAGCGDAEKEKTKEASSWGESTSPKNPERTGDAAQPAEQEVLRLQLTGDALLYREMTGTVTYAGKALAIQSCYGPLWVQGRIGFVLFPYELTEANQEALRQTPSLLGAAAVAAQHASPDSELWPQSAPWVDVGLAMPYQTVVQEAGKKPTFVFDGNELKQVTIGVHDWEGREGNFTVVQANLDLEETHVSSFEGTITLDDLSLSGLAIARLRASANDEIELDLALPAEAPSGVPPPPEGAPEKGFLADFQPPANTGNWKETRERLHELVEKKTTVELNKRLDPAKIAAELGYPYPVPSPTRSVEEVEKLALAAARADVEQKYPPDLAKKFHKQALETFPKWDIGDQVSFTIRGGRGPNTKVEGRLRTVAAQRIQVDNRWIIREDIDEATLVRLDPELHRAKVDQFVRRRQRELQAEKDEYREQRYAAHGRRLMRESMYALHDKRWIPANKLLRMVIEYRRKRILDTIKPRIEKSIFRSSGYVQRNGRWVPESALDRLKSALDKQDSKE